MEPTTTTGSTSREAGRSDNLGMAEPLKNSAKATPVAGKNTREKPVKSTGAEKQNIPLPAEDEFDIFLAQVGSCRRSGIDMKWMELHPGDLITLAIPGAKKCPNNHVYVGEKCNYCKV